MLFHALQQFELRFGAHQVVFRILNLIVCITVNVIGKETHTLHIGEQCGRIRQILYLHRQQERLDRKSVV